MTIKYTYGMVHPAIESMDDYTLVWMLCCAIQNIEVTVTEMVPFAPNEYLYETHKDKGEEKWEVFAWACRDIMAKVGGFGKHDIAFKDKMQVFDYYLGKLDKLQFENGEIVEYRVDGNYDIDRNKKNQ